jgi:hypothetical protein
MDKQIERKIMDSVEIKFEYVNPEGLLEGKCWKESRWGGCCCSCIYHMQVNKHCSHSTRDKGSPCVCDESLGFHICFLFNHLERAPAQIMGKHGFCAMYDPYDSVKRKNFGSLEYAQSLRGNTYKVKGNHKWGLENKSSKYETIEVIEDTEVTVGDPGSCWTPLYIKGTDRLVFVYTDILGSVLKI